MAKGVHAVIGNPPYNTGRIAVLSYLEFGRPSLQDMTHFLELLSA